MPRDINLIEAAVGDIIDCVPIGLQVEQSLPHEFPYEKPLLIDFFGKVSRLMPNPMKETTDAPGIQNSIFYMTKPFASKGGIHP